MAKKEKVIKKELKISEVKEWFNTTKYSEANDYIKQGFVTFKILSSKVRTDVSDIMLPMFVLGR